MPSCKLNVVTVVEESSTINKEAVNERISEKLVGIDYTINVIENIKVADGILDFIHANETDLLVLIRKDYGFIEGLLHTSVTKKIALHADKPMLLYKSCE